MRTVKKYIKNNKTKKKIVRATFAIQLSASKISYCVATIMNRADGYSGEQIILNSGRLVLNSKSDSIMLSSFQTIGLNSLNSVNIDSPSTVIKSRSVALGDKNASEPMILGNKFLSDFEDLCRALSTMADVLATNPVGGPGDISVPIVPLTPAATKLSTLAANMLSRITEYKSKTTTSR